MVRYTQFENKHTNTKKKVRIEMKKKESAHIIYNKMLNVKNEMQ